MIVSTLRFLHWVFSLFVSVCLASDKSPRMHFDISITIQGSDSVNYVYKAIPWMQIPYVMSILFDLIFMVQQLLLFHVNFSLTVGNSITLFGMGVPCKVYMSVRHGSPDLIMISCNNDSGEVFGSNLYLRYNMQKGNCSWWMERCKV